MSNSVAPYMTRAIFFVLFLTGILFIYPGLYYNEMTDVFISIMSRGLLTEQPVNIFNNYGSHFLLGRLYPVLYGKLPFDWLGIFLILFLIASTCIFAAIFISLSGNKDNRVTVISGVCLTFWMVHDICLVQSTSVSLMLIFCSAWLLFFRQQQIPKVFSASSIVLFCLFVAGLLLRPLGIFFIAFTFLPPLLLQAYSKKRIELRKVIISSVLVLPAVLAIQVLSSRPVTGTDRDYASFVQYKSSVWDNGQPISTLKLTSAADSANYQCLSLFFIPEKKMISPAYLKAIGIFPAHSPVEFLKTSLKQIPYKYKRASEKWSEILSFRKRWYFLAACIVLLFLLASDRASILRMAAITGWTFFSLFILSVLAKMEERVLFPALAIMLLLLFEQTTDRPVNGKLYPAAAITVLLLGLSFMIPDMHDILQRRKGQKAIHELHDHLKRNYPQRIIMLDAFSSNIFCNRILAHQTSEKSIPWFTIDPGYLIFYKNYYDRQSSLTGTSTFYDLVLYMKQHPDRFAFLYIEDRISLLERYTRIQYREPLEFSKPEAVLQTGEIVYGDIQYNLYTLK